MTSPRPAPRPRPSVEALHAYVPGEQPRDPLLVKLNTNENPYPPSPRVLEALAAYPEARVRKYPDPNCEALRGALAESLAVPAPQIIATNGSDEVLKMLVEAYVDPGERVGYLWPTYSLYPVFVAKHQGVEVRLPFSGGEAGQTAALLAAPADLRLLFVTNPNPPIGLPIALDAIRELAAARPDTLVVVDEAYIAYGGESAVALVREGVPNIFVTRSFSKSHSLAGLRAGFGVGKPAAIDALLRIKDSYNVSGATQAAALASWQDDEYTAGCVARIVATRARIAGELRRRGFSVEESAGNFVFARRADAPQVFAALRAAHVLVRYWPTPELRDGLRITIGTDAEMDSLLAALDA